MDLKEYQREQRDPETRNQLVWLALVFGALVGLGWACGDSQESAPINQPARLLRAPAAALEPAWAPSCRGRVSSRMDCWLASQAK